MNKNKGRPTSFFQSNIPEPLKLPKGKIEKIQFGEHEQEIKRIWEGKPPAKLIEKWKQKGVSISQAQRYYNAGSMLARMSKIKLLVGYSSNLIGLCSECKNLNTHLVKYKTQGITIVERYCSEHVPDKI